MATRVRDVATGIACLATLPFTLTARAQGEPPDWTGPYFGGGGTYSTVSVETNPGCHDCYYWWGDWPEYREGDGDYSYSAHVGWGLNRWVALEAGYVDGGTITWTKGHVYMPEFDGYYHNDVEFTSTVPEVSLLLLWPFAGRWEVYFRTGAGFWDGESRQFLVAEEDGAVIDRTVHDDGTGWLMGVGVGCSFAQRWHVRFDFQSLFIDGEVLNVRSDTSLDSMLLELQYRFGAHTPPTSQPPGESTPVE